MHCALYQSQQISRYQHLHGVPPIETSPSLFSPICSISSLSSLKTFWLSLFIHHIFFSFFLSVFFFRSKRNNRGMYRIRK
ncbi:hypothetical protein VTP01DRAFT_10061 [Rhizomucor pusillus]|uniref:uncharacterized protein n=1 Tax=Rhizomucor pusillus TaxID=4840 RepID=UPI0037440179